MYLKLEKNLTKKEKKMTNSYDWIQFYEEFANKLRTYRNKRVELLSFTKNLFETLPLKYPFNYQGKDQEDFGPFTFMGIFNKNLKDENLFDLVKSFKKFLNIKAPIPTSFKGVPRLNSQNAWLYADEDSRGENDIENLWNLFEISLDYADTTNE